MADIAGRVCPLDYRTDPAALNRAPDIAADTLYVVGGLYGNPFALDTIEAMASTERHPVTIIFNGDAHWFDADAATFRNLDRRLAAYPAIRGNVETELGRATVSGAGCGCAYPPEVDEGVVQRSNAILARLQGIAGADERARLSALPTTRVAHVGGVRIGIVHGDPTSIAGWGFSRENLDKPDSARWLDELRRASHIDVFASTHTCGAVMREFYLPSGRMIVANNGAAGMANFAGETAGLLTRISVHRLRHAPHYGVRLGAVHVEAIPIPFDAAAFLALFDAIWPRGTPAEVSYRKRIAGHVGSQIRDAKPRKLARAG
jgi:hypothetical protein